MDLVKNILEKSGEDGYRDKIVIASQWVEHLKIVDHFLQSLRHVKTAFLIGSTKMDRRQVLYLVTIFKRYL